MFTSKEEMQAYLNLAGEVLELPHSAVKQIQKIEKDEGLESANILKFFMYLNTYTAVNHPSTGPIFPDNFETHAAIVQEFSGFIFMKLVEKAAKDLTPRNFFHA